MTHEEFYIDRSMKERCDVDLERDIIVRTPQEDVYCWLEQMYGETGGYTFDFFENLRSKNIKHLKNYPRGTRPGDKVGLLKVLDVDPEKGITYEFSFLEVLNGMFGYYLEPISYDITRLLVKIKIKYNSFISAWIWNFIHPIDFILMNKQLSNIKEYAESNYQKKKKSLSVDSTRIRM